MRIKYIYILNIALLCTFSLQGQTLPKDTKHLKAFDALHSESIYIHQNASLLLAGEQLYYTVYCLNKTTNVKSTLSKVAYVELVGAEGIPVFRHKIKLNLGIGQGDFFIPTSISSGNYKLIGYTQWMKNGNKNQFFISDINIVNTFRKNQNLLLDKEMVAKVDSIVLNEFNNTVKSSVSQSSGIKLLTDKTKFGQRERVKVSLDNLIEEQMFGTYSISVRKKEAIIVPKMTPADKFLTQSGNKSNELSNSDSIYLPELRGEILYGKVISKATNSPVSNMMVALSIPGKDHVVKITKTNTKGGFYFNLDKSTDQQNAYLQILGAERATHKISMYTSQSPSFTNLTFDTLKFTPRMAQLLVERSVHNQIENAYLEVKQDTLSPIFNTKQFYQKYDYEYNLDDYTRFATIKEVMLEVIDHVWTARNSDGKRELQIRGYENNPGKKEEPLVLVDGLILQDHEGILDLDARKVRKIGVRLHEFKFGPKTYNGILAFETIDGTFPSTYKNEHLFTHQLFNPLGHKTYFKQNYAQKSSKELDLLPDFRYQLLWTPTFELNEYSKSIDFFTSDVLGSFEISVEGITDNGEPISLRASFTVE